MVARCYCGTSSETNILSEQLQNGIQLAEESSLMEFLNSEKYRKICLEDDRGSVATLGGQIKRYLLFSLSEARSHYCERLGRQILSSVR